MNYSLHEESVKSVVFIVEDDPTIRESLRLLVEMTGARAEAFGRGQELLEAMAVFSPSCVVMDMGLPDMGGLELLQRLQEQHAKSVPTIVITGRADVRTAVAVMKLGAVDFIEKPFAPRVFQDQVTAAVQTERIARRQLDHRARSAGAVATLSPRQRQVLDGLLRGKPNKQVAVELEMSVKTVATHRANILRRMHVGSLVELAQRLAAA